VRATIELRGLSVAPSQIWRGVRLVPVVRDEPITDLRLDPICYGDGPSVVALDERTTYSTFIPHAFVASWSPAGEPMAALGTQAGGKRSRPAKFPVQHHHRMVKRVRERGSATNSLRFLPLHTAFEGYLALHFAGPDVVRPGYDWAALSQGLSPRIEIAPPGEWIEGLEDALRVFEILERQVGVLLFVADALAAAFVIPHPDDYRRLHRTLVGDFYGELIWRYACMYDSLPPTISPINAEQVTNIADLGRELARIRARWAEHLHGMAAGLFGQEVTIERVYRLGRHELHRFLPDFNQLDENHIGELIRTPNDDIAYLKTFRLSAAQIRRGYLLSTLARHEWDLEGSAAAMNITQRELLIRLHRAELGGMLARG